MTRRGTIRRGAGAGPAAAMPTGRAPRGRGRSQARPDRRPVRRAAFTLIELLVVIAILGLLISLLVPSLGRSKQLARRVVCLTNLRGMAVAASQYAAEGDGSYPLAKYTPQDTSEYTYISWDFRYRADGRIEAGLLWLAEEHQKIQQCPSFRGEANWAGDPYTGYNYNTSYIGHGDWEAIFAPAKVSDVREPHRCALFGDGEYAGGANKFMRAPLPNPGDAQFTARYAGTQGYRHIGATNVAFADGHAAVHEERYTQTEPAGNSAQIAEGTGFLSPDNSLYDLE